MDHLFDHYILPNAIWDEMYANQEVRDHYKQLFTYLSEISQEELNNKEDLSKKLFMSQGITFTVYSSNEGIEKIFPFDVIPRIITATEWQTIEAGIKQRLTALNLFLKDVYANQEVLRSGIVPTELVYSCPHFLREMVGLKVPHDIYVHIAGIDLIRDSDGSVYFRR